MVNGSLITNLHSSLRRGFLLPSYGKFGEWGYVSQRHVKDAPNFSPRPKAHSQRKHYYQFAILGSALTTCGLLYYYVKAKKRNVLSASSITTKQNFTEICPGEFKPGLPYYTLKQVAEHDKRNNGVWVSFGHGVYDITPFIDEHPGGDRILMAAGGSLEPFWLLYAVHKKHDVLLILEKYRIGNLSPEDIADFTQDIDDPYGLDPTRHPALKPSSVKPFNAETPLSLLVDSFITPTYVIPVENSD